MEEVSNAKTATLLVDAFDRALSKPPFICTDAVLDSAARLRDFVAVESNRIGLGSCKPIAETLPIVASSLFLGFPKASDALPLLDILCAALTHCYPLLSFPLHKFFRDALQHASDLGSLVDLMDAAKALDESACRQFLHLDALPPAASSSSSMPKQAVKRPESQKKTVSASPATASSSVPPQVRRPSDSVLLALCRAKLNSNCEKLFLQQVDTTAKFTDVVGSKSSLAAAILSRFSVYLVPRLKPAAFEYCLHVATVQYFAQVLCGASSDAVATCRLSIAPVEASACIATLLQPHVLGSAGGEGVLRAVVALLPSCQRAVTVCCIAEIIAAAGAMTSSPVAQECRSGTWMSTICSTVEAVDERAREIGSHTSSLVPELSDIGPFIAGVQRLQQFFLDELTRHSKTQAPPKPSSAKKSSSDSGNSKKKASANGSSPAPARHVDASAVDETSVVAGRFERTAEGALRGLFALYHIVVRCFPQPRAQEILDDEIARALPAIIAQINSWLITTNRLLPKDVVRRFFAFWALCVRRWVSNAGAATFVMTPSVVFGESTVKLATVLASIDKECFLLLVDVLEALRLPSHRCSATGVVVDVELLLRFLLDSLVTASLNVTETARVVSVWDRFSSWLPTDDATRREVVKTFCQHRVDQRNGLDALRRMLDSVAHAQELMASESPLATNLWSVVQQLQSQRAAEESNALEALAKKAGEAFAEQVALRERRQREAEAIALRQATLREKRSALAQKAVDAMRARSSAALAELQARRASAVERLQRLEEEFRAAAAKRKADAKLSALQYKKRSAKAQEILDFLKGLDVPDFAASKAASFFFSKPIDSVSNDLVLEFLVTGEAEIPTDLAHAVSLNHEHTDTSLPYFADELCAAQTADSQSSTSNGDAATSFWGQVLRDISATGRGGSDGRAAGSGEISHAAPHHSAARVRSLHFRLSSLLDLFDLDGTALVEPQELPRSLVRSVLESSSAGEVVPVSKSGACTLDGRSTLGLLEGFEDAMHMVTVAENKRLVAVVGGKVRLTKLGFAYHQPYWRKERSMAARLAARREIIRAAVGHQEAEKEMEEAEGHDEGTLDLNSENGSAGSSSDGEGELFCDELL